jgi:hypothetical protein
MFTVPPAFIKCSMQVYAGSLLSHTVFFVATIVAKVPFFPDSLLDGDGTESIESLRLHNIQSFADLKADLFPAKGCCGEVNLLYIKYCHEPA